MTSLRMKATKDIRFQKRLGVGVLVVGVLAVAVGVVMFAQSRRFYASALHAPGKIVELEQKRDRKEITIFPVFSFVDQAGVSHVVHSKWGYPTNWWWLARRHAVGDDVEVIYPPDDPENAKLNNFLSVWGWTILFGGGGTVLAGAGIVLWHGAIRWQRELSS
jgi:hypothetical protein